MAKPFVPGRAGRLALRWWTRLPTSDQRRAVRDYTLWMNDEGDPLIHDVGNAVKVWRALNYINKPNLKSFNGIYSALEREQHSGKE